MTVEQRMEQRVVRSACQELISQGCALSLYYGEGEYGIKHTNIADAVVKEMHACDDEWIRVTVTVNSWVASGLCTVTTAGT